MNISLFKIFQEIRIIGMSGHVQKIKIRLNCGKNEARKRQWCACDILRVSSLRRFVNVFLHVF